LSQLLSLMATALSGMTTGHVSPPATSQQENVLTIVASAITVVAKGGITNTVTASHPGQDMTSRARKGRVQMPPGNMMRSPARNTSPHKHSAVMSVRQCQNSPNSAMKTKTPDHRHSAMTCRGF
jgi:hypothetical protein